MGTLKANIHGDFTADPGASTVVSSDGKYLFAIGSRSLGSAGVLDGYPRE